MSRGLLWFTVSKIELEQLNSRVAPFFSRVPEWMILLLFGLVFSAQVVLSVSQKSATFDEPANLASGYFTLKYRDQWLMPQNLPLVKELAAIPLLFFHVKLPPARKAVNSWAFGEYFLYESNDGDTLLLLARLAVLPLSLLLGTLVFLWTRQLFGKGAAFWALFLYAFEPNILAHSALVTTDLGVACFIFLAVFGLWQLARRVSPFRL